MSIKEKLEDVKVLDAEILKLVGEEEELEGEIAEGTCSRKSLIDRASGRASQSNTVTSAALPTTAVPTLARGSRARLPKLTIKLLALMGHAKPRSSLLVLHYLLTHPHHIAASVNNSTHRRIVKQSQELSPVVSHYKELVDASFVWERVTYPGIVVAESSVLAAREDTMLQFAQATTSSLWTYSEKTVLLQMAQATVFNPDLPSRTLRVGLKLRNGQTQLLTLFSVPIICGPLIPHHLVKYREAYPHLEGLEFADDPGNVQQLHVDILIGSDYYWDLITGRLQRGLDGPVAIQTKLGWVLSGPISTPDQAESSHSIMTHVIHVDCQSLDSTLNDTMKSFWELESFGIPDADRSLYDEYRDTIRFHEGRYEVQLPWKMPRQNLPNNYDLSLKRLKGLLHRLKHDCDILLEYDTTIKTQLQQGIIERVEEPKIVDTSGVHYIPHHAVIRRDKTTTKLRIVYDASSKTDGFSLNDCLNPGPKFDQRILDILCRFPSPQSCCDSRHRKGIPIDLCCSKRPRFPSFSVGRRSNQRRGRALSVYRFTRVVFGVNASPFLLNATLRHHLELHSESHRDLDPKVLRSIYVDDIVTGSGSNEEAYELYAGAKALLKAGAFNLRKFSTNSRSLQATNNSEEAVHLKNLFPIPSDNLEMFSQGRLGVAKD
eukprot:Em0017g666a